MLRKLFRRKYVDRDESRTELSRVLTTFDLTLLGIGSTLGTGIYILAGEVAYKTAGPSVVLSFLVAAFASVLAGVASVSKAYSNTVDNMIPDHAMSQAFKDVGEINVSFLGEYFDFFAFGIAGVLTILLILGVKESSIFNNICTVLNLLVVVFAVIAGGIYSSTDFWRIDPVNYSGCKNISGHSAVKEGEVGSGGFFPFGVTGMMAGAATCFYGFIGFDVLATTGEEAKNPKKSIPMSIVISLFFIFLAYFGISTVMTMMLPYYCQDVASPLPFAFEYNGFNAGKWIVNIGALFGLSTSLLGSMFPMPRIIYAMAQDGLLFKFLGKVHPKLQTPIWATLIGGLIGALMGALFKLDALIEMMSIGTLTAYTIVAVCVLMLRYRPDESEYFDETSSVEALAAKSRREGWISQVFNAKNAREPSRGSGKLTCWVVVAYWILCFGFCATLILGEGSSGSGRMKRAAVESTTEAFSTLAILFLVFFGLLMFLCLLSLSRQAVSRTKLSFKVPLLPWIPALSVLINTYLILKLSWPTWVRFGIWLVIGLVIYLYCLCTGRADRVYDDNYTQFQTLSRTRGKKISFPGIDNSGMDFRDEGEKETEKRNGTAAAEYENKQSHKNGVGAGGNGGEEKNRMSNKAGNIPEAVNPIVKIHELNQKSLNGEVIPMEELVLVSKEKDERGKGEEQVAIVKSQAPIPAPRITPAPKMMTGPPVVEEIPREVLALHEKAQECFKEVPEVMETPEDVVDGVVVMAETAAPIMDAKYSQKAQQLVDDAFRMALENLDEGVTMSTIGSETDPDPLPPFVVKSNQLNEFQLMQLNSTNSPSENRVVLIEPSSVKDPVQHIHQVCQAEINGSAAGAGFGLLLADKAEDGLNNVTKIPVTPDAMEKNASQEPPVLPKGFISKVLITHEAAKEMMRGEDSIQEIHQIYQEAIDDVRGSEGGKEAILVSPGLREEAKKLIQDYVSDVENHNVAEVKEGGGPASVPEGMVQEILKIHEDAKEELKEADPMDTIHEICKRVLEDIEEALQNHPLLLSSRSQREEAREVARSALEASTVQDKKEVGSSEVSVLSPEDVAVMMISHANAQEQFDDLRSAQPEEKYNVNTMHDIAQLNLNGVSAESVPWLEPVLSSEEEKEGVRRVTRSLVEERVRENVASEPDPPPPHIVRKMEEDLKRAHLLAQEALSESAEEKATRALVSESPDATTSIHAIAQLCLDGVSVDTVSWLDPVLSKPEDKKSIQKLTESLVEEGARNVPPTPSVSLNERAGSEAGSGISEHLLDIHRRVQEVLDEGQPKPQVPQAQVSTENQIEKIHNIAQLALDGVPVDTVPWLKAVTSSDEEREEIKETTKRLVEAAAKSGPPPPTPAPVSENVPKEIPEEILEIHNAAQDKLNERYVTAPQTPIDEPATSIIEQIHQIVQLNMSDVESIPWLSPAVSTEESKREIRDLNKRLTTQTEAAFYDSGNTPDTLAADTNGGLFGNQIKKIHEAAQITLGPVQKVGILNKKPVTFAEKFPQFEPPEDSDGEFVTVDSVFSDLPSTTPNESSENSHLPTSPSPASPEATEGKRFRIETKVFLSPTSETSAVKFDNSPSYMEAEIIEPQPVYTNDRDSIRRRIMNRRPTGPALPGLKQFHAKLSGSTAEESEEDDEEVGEGEEQDDEIASSSSNQSLEHDDRKATELEPQPAVPRRQSNSQNKSQSMRDLISLFEQGKSS